MTTERERGLEEALRLLARSARTVFGALPIGQSLQPAGSAHTNDLIYATDEADNLLSASPLRPEGEVATLREELIDIVASNLSSAFDVKQAIRKAVDRLEAARPQPPQQPVAWAKSNLAANLDRNGQDTIYRQRAPTFAITEPLYAAPLAQPVATAGEEELEELEELEKKAFDEGWEAGKKYVQLRPHEFELAPLTQPQAEEAGK